MAVTAPRAIQSSQPSFVPSDLAERDETGADCAAIAAFRANPDSHLAVAAFREALQKLDKSASRSDALTEALTVAMSATEMDIEEAVTFAQDSLGSEIHASLQANEPQITLPRATWALTTALLYHRRVTNLLLEDVLIEVRRMLLETAETGETPGTDQLCLAEALARHNFGNEFLWDETEAEGAKVGELVGRIARKIEVGAAVSAFELFVVGAYRPLVNVAAVRDWVRALGCRSPSALDPTLRLLVLDRLVEDELEIETLTPITSEVSQKVRSQYEENPYPRWRHLPPHLKFDQLTSYVSTSIRQQDRIGSGAPDQAKVLIAGAGTGQHPISVAQCLPKSAVLAIDLSRASLAYATREAKALGVQNIAFAQADILKLAEADVQFDLIESCGVLHHMEDPEAGLQALLKILKPGGYLKLGLYSRIARRAINAARDRFAASGHASDLSGIRAFRRDLISSDDPAVHSLRAVWDFYSASEFRDLVMHVQEHQYTLPEINALLKRNGLKFLGFSSRSAVTVLENMPAKMARRKLRDLDAWDRYEKRNPDTFLCMYEFFCIKR